MNKSESINELAAALAKVQAVLKGAEKNATNPHFRADFANLESVWESIRGCLPNHGLSVAQLMGISPQGEPTLITMLLHSSGQWISGEQLLKPVKQDPQALGSAITYARRYGLAAIVGQIQTDDDGEQGMGRDTKPESKPKAPLKEVPKGDPNDLANYVVKMGKKFKGQKLGDCDIYELSNFAQWLGEQQDLKGVGLETKQAIDTYVKTREFERAK